MEQRSHHGFTLIELSIVLVIIGLLIGGALVGRELIEVATIRNQIKQVDQVKQAFQTFRFKYGAMPGDLYEKAPDFDLSSGYQDADRDNGNINDFSANNSPIRYARDEPLYFFGHLVEAGMLSGNFMDSPCDSLLFWDETRDISYYSMAMDKAMGVIATSWNGAHWLYLGISNCDATLDFRLGSGTTGRADVTGVMTPLRAHMIDQKLDNGVPGTGGVLAAVSSSGSLNAIDSNVGQCVTSAISTHYNVTDTTKQCRLLVRMQ